jgi:hypothetical protein
MDFSSISCKLFTIILTSAFVLMAPESRAATSCLPVMLEDQQLAVDDAALKALERAGLSQGDLFHTLRLVSKYETGGCWAGATGDSDGQLLSVGVMQWNLGQGTLQPLLKRFSEKFSSASQFQSVRDELMPKYGKKLFDVSCRVKPVQAACRSFLKSKMSGRLSRLDPDLKEEIDRLFNDRVMRQLQLDYFSRSVTSVLSDLDRVYLTPKPAPWQVAWAVDLKTQQGERFPTDKNIRKVRQYTDMLSVEERKKRLGGIVKWYEGLCDSGTSEGIKGDCPYNVKTWPSLFDRVVSDKAREQTIHFSHLVARTAQNIDGGYQGDSFQRRAAIVFGSGSVHRTVYDFSAQ